MSSSNQKKTDTPAARVLTCAFGEGGCVLRQRNVAEPSAHILNRPPVHGNCTHQREAKSVARSEAEKLRCRSPA
jgi:hypothetical protein